MGQKINQLGFRLCITQSNHSLWFAKQKNSYGGLQEDQKRSDKNDVQKNMGISSDTEGNKTRGTIASILLNQFFNTMSSY
ncbi:hypothetical protein KSP39_PZI018797 [Platanthera zijinensis]|uniref:Ribosomal protein S3 n=1 Tax=Platanthera zijinensis TaxID=2320716 RepID=A0AAP0FYX1_9ASPA